MTEKNQTDNQKPLFGRFNKEKAQAWKYRLQQKKKDKEDEKGSGLPEANLVIRPKSPKLDK